MLKRFFPLWLCLLLSHAQATQYPVTIPHAAGQSTVPKKPLRVVALGPHALDLLLSLGVQPVGYGEASNYIKMPSFGTPLRSINVLGSRVTSNPINVGDRFKPNLEILAQLKPDLIVGEDYASQSYSGLNRVAPTLLFKGIDHNDWQKSLLLLAKALDREAKANSIIKDFNKKASITKQKLSAIMGNKRVLVLITDGTSNNTVFTISGSQDWTGGLLKDIGLNVIDGDKKDATISIEGLAALNPDSIIVLPSGTDTPTRARKAWFSNSLTSSLRASKDKQVYFFDYHLFRRVRGPIAAELVERQLLREIKN